MLFSFGRRHCVLLILLGLTEIFFGLVLHIAISKTSIEFTLSLYIQKKKQLLALPCLSFFLFVCLSHSVSLFTQILRQGRDHTLVSGIMCYWVKQSWRNRAETAFDSQSQANSQQPRWPPIRTSAMWILLMLTYSFVRTVHNVMINVLLFFCNM